MIYFIDQQEYKLVITEYTEIIRKSNDCGKLITTYDMLVDIEYPFTTLFTYVATYLLKIFVFQHANDALPFYIAMECKMQVCKFFCGPIKVHIDIQTQTYRHRLQTTDYRLLGLYQVSISLLRMLTCLFQVNITV